jgi:hypothetical protein
MLSDCYNITPNCIRKKLHYSMLYDYIMADTTSIASAAVPLPLHIHASAAIPLSLVVLVTVHRAISTEPKSCVVPFGFASFQSRAASHLDRVTTDGIRF